MALEIYMTMTINQYTGDGDGRDGDGNDNVDDADDAGGGCGSIDERDAGENCHAMC